MAGESDVLVVGAGLHGSSAALYLAKAGLRVSVLDTGSGGRHSSKVNAGGIRCLMRAVEELPMAIEALDIWHRIRDVVDDDCGTKFHGQICVAETSDDLDKLEQRFQFVRGLGYEHEELMGQSELRKLIPALSKTYLGALISRGDGFGSPFRSTFMFQEKAKALGAVLHRNTNVVAIEESLSGWQVTTTDGRVFRSTCFVNCAGAWGDRIAALIGESIPISAEAPMMMVTAPIVHFLDLVVIGAGRKLSLKQLPNGPVLIGGGHRGKLDRDYRITSLNIPALSQSAKTVMDAFPHLANASIVRAWAGIEAVTPDRLPVLGQSTVAKDAYHSFGYSSHGYALAPVTGRLIAELVVRGRASLPLERFKPDRFSTPEQPHRPLAWN